MVPVQQTLEQAKTDYDHTQNQDSSNNNNNSDIVTTAYTTTTTFYIDTITPTTRSTDHMEELKKFISIEQERQIAAKRSTFFGVILQQGRAWNDLPHSNWAKQWATSGAIWPMETMPPRTDVTQEFYPDNKKVHSALQQEITQMLADGRVSKFEDYRAMDPQKRYAVIRIKTQDGWKRQVLPFSEKPHFVSAMGAVKKKGTTKLRVIINLQKFNTFTAPVTFRLDKWEDVANSLTPGALLLSLDLEAGFHQIPVNWHYRTMLGFRFSNQYYVWNVLPFGLHAAPWMFTVMLKPAMTEARRRGLTLLVYLDDVLLVLQKPENTTLSQEQIKVQVQILLQCLKDFGWLINWNKSKLSPSFSIDHLGFTVNTHPHLPTAMITVTEEKKVAITKTMKNALSRNYISAMKLASILGSLNFLTRAVWVGPPMLREGYQLLATKASWSSRLKISQELRNEWSWWIQILPTWKGTDPRLHVRQPEMILTTDASEWGWGAWLTTHSTQPEETWEITHSTFGRFPPQVAVQSSNFRELTAIIMAMLSFKQTLHKKVILLRSDNSTSVACVNKLRTSSASLNELIIYLTEIMETEEIAIKAMHLAGTENELADYLSRFSETGDWATNPRIFEHLDQCWGPHTIDRFASYQNHKVHRYNSAVPDPLAEAVDAFQAGHWRWNTTGLKECNYWNPPFHLLAETVARIVSDRAEGTLIAPHWHQHQWFQVLIEISRDSIELSGIPDLFLTGLYGNSKPMGSPWWRVSAWKISWSP